MSTNRQPDSKPTVRENGIFRGALQLDCLCVRMPVLIVDTCADQDCVWGYQQRHFGVSCILGAVMRSAQDVGRKVFPKQPGNCVPTFVLRVSRYQVGESTLAGSRQLQDYATVIGIIHILVVR